MGPHNKFYIKFDDLLVSVGALNRRLNLYEVSYVLTPVSPCFLRVFLPGPPLGVTILSKSTIF